MHGIVFLICTLHTIGICFYCRIRIMKLISVVLLHILLPHIYLHSNNNDIIRDLYVNLTTIQIS